MEWQEGGGPLDNVSVQNDNYGNKDFFFAADLVVMGGI